MITPYKTILLIIFVIDKFIIARCLSSTTIIIDVDKGIALHKIGVYAEKYQESIFHIFIPYNNLCIDSPNSDVCEYIQSASPDIVEVGTILPHVNTLSTSYSRENISHIIQEDIRRIFLYHKVDKFIGKSKSIIYFIDNHFYVTRSTTKSITAPTFPINITQLALIPRAINPATLVVEQVFNNKVGYDFLTDEQIKDILALIVSTNDETLDIKNIKENLNMLTDMIVGQTVYALKSCSMQKNEHLRSGPACLAVSTIIRRLPVESSSIYQVYRLTPLPVFFKGKIYVYSDLPAIFGFNNINKKVVLWNDDDLLNTCTLSKIVQCRNYPINIPLSALPCLNELFDSRPLSMSKCEVKTSNNIQPNILNIKNNIWYAYPRGELFECEPQSLSSPISDIISINEPMIVTLPCDRPVRCSNILLPSTACANTTITLTGKVNNTLNQQSLSIIRFNNITNRIMSIYKAAAKNVFMELQLDIDIDQPWIKKIFKEFGSYLLSLLCFTLLSVILFVIKIIKTKLHKQIEKVQTEINRIQRDIIRET